MVNPGNDGPQRKIHHCLVCHAGHGIEHHQESRSFEGIPWLKSLHGSLCWFMQLDHSESNLRPQLLLGEQQLTSPRDLFGALRIKRMPQTHRRGTNHRTKSRNTHKPSPTNSHSAANYLKQTPSNFVIMAALHEPTQNEIPLPLSSRPERSVVEGSAVLAPPLHSPLIQQPIFLKQTPSNFAIMAPLHEPTQNEIPLPLSSRPERSVVEGLAVLAPPLHSPLIQQPIFLQQTPPPLCHPVRSEAQWRDLRCALPLNKSQAASSTTSFTTNR